MRVLSVLMAVIIGCTVPAFAADYVAIGNDLSDSQKETVLELLGVDDLSQCDVVVVTNEEEHEYLDSYVPSSEIGTKALSSVVVRDAEDGVTVTTKNINYCTEGMYTNALITAGVTNADVVVAAPFEMSGTAALIGVLEAYAVMTGEPIEESVIDAAVDEITTTGEIEEATGYTEEVEAVIAYVKNTDISDLTDEEIDEEIRKAADSFGLWLDDEEVYSIRELLKKLKGLDLDWDTISQHAQSIFDSISTPFIEKVRAVFNNIIDFFKGVFRRN